MRGHLVLWSMLGAGLAAALIGGSAAYGYHSVPATYTGTHSGGGTVDFDVRATSVLTTINAVTRFKATSDLGCGFTMGFETTVTLPIFDPHAFGASSPELTGTFHAPQAAQGTIRLRSLSPPFCTGPTLTWTAMTTAPPPRQCRDGVDNDGDGKIDSLDRGCTGPDDDDETDTAPAPFGFFRPELGGGGGGVQHDIQGPQASLFGGAVQKAGPFVAVGVICRNEACQATGQGTVNVPGAARRFRLRPAQASIAAGDRKTLRLRVPARTLRSIRSALRKRRRVAARVTVTARDGAGNRTVRRRTIRLRR